MNTNKISIKTSNKNYSIVIGRDLIGKIDKILKANRLKFDKCLIVTDKNIPHKFKRLLYKKLKTNKLVKIEITAANCPMMTNGTAIFSIDFALRFMTNCYDIITIYHQSSSISISCTGQGGAVL